MSSDELNVALSRLKKATQRLGEAIQKADRDTSGDGVIEDAVIKRFEFTFELFWKCLKAFLEKQGIQCRSPKNCLEEAFNFGLLRSEKPFTSMLEDRNKTAHIYSKEESEKIFEKIRDNYFEAFKEIVKKLESKV